MIFAFIDKFLQKYFRRLDRHKKTNAKQLIKFIKINLTLGVKERR
jgi:hypothetical protein